MLKINVFSNESFLPSIENCFFFVTHIKKIIFLALIEYVFSSQRRFTERSTSTGFVLISSTFGVLRCLTLEFVVLAQSKVNTKAHQQYLDAEICEMLPLPSNRQTWELLILTYPNKFREVHWKSFWKYCLRYEEIRREKYKSRSKISQLCLCVFVILCIKLQ
jgi:hypothetical protein